MKLLQRSDAHFPYRKYAAQRQRRRLRARWRRLLQAHDLWAWIFVIAILLMFFLLEVLR
mgnify:CR=1 FL=1